MISWIRCLVERLPTFQGNMGYSKKSNYEQMRKLADSYGASGNKEKQNECYTVVEDMAKRISNRRRIKQQDENDIEI